jgi:hypothetical protein
MRIFALLLVVCSAHANVVIGDPIPGPAPGSGIVFTDLELPVYQLRIDRCDNTVDTLTVDETYGLGDPLPIPDGAMCGLEIITSDRLVVEGYGTAGGTFTLDLQVGAVTVDVYPAVDVDDAEDTSVLRLASAGWVTATSLGLSSGQHVTVDPQHTLHGSLRYAVRNDSTIIP